MKEEQNSRSRARASLLAEGQAERIFEGALEILEGTGAKVESQEALAILKGQGAIVDGDVARLPRDLVRNCLETVPKRLVINGRDGAPPLRLGEGNTYFAPGMTCPNVLDPITGERRPFGRSDTRVVGLLADALPNMDFVIGGGIIEDVTPTLSAAYEFGELASCTNKPLFGWAHDEVVLEDIYQMACAVAGSEDAFQRTPTCLIFINPVSPLVLSPDVAKRVMFAARHNVPIIIWPYVMAGGTNPMTIAGAMAATLAEVLSALTLSQSTRLGAPFVFGTSINIMDMKIGIPIGGPRGIAAGMALADLMRHLGVISYLPAGGNPTKSVDQQSAIHLASSLTAMSLAGPDLIAGLGGIEGGMTASPAVLVMADDVIGMVRRIRQGIEVSEETLALEVTKRVGPGGHFLMEDHTLAHFREEQWEPSLIDLGTYDEWDGRTMGERIKERVESILSMHKPVPLPDKVQSTIEDILRRAEEREAKAGK